VLEDLFDTPIGKIAGGISALAGAVFFYRACYRLFEWMFTTRVWEVFGWLVTIAFAAVFIWLAMKLWSRWRLVFGAALAFSAVWSIVHLLPRIDEAVDRLGNDRFGFVQTTTIYANAIILLTVAVVSLFADRILAWWKPRIEQHRNSASRGKLPWQ
jgi:hypothetical protein